MRWVAKVAILPRKGPLLTSGTLVGAAEEPSSNSGVRGEESIVEVDGDRADP